MHFAHFAEFFSFASWFCCFAWALGLPLSDIFLVLSSELPSLSAVQALSGAAACCEKGFTAGFAVSCAASQTLKALHKNFTNKNLCFYIFYYFFFICFSGKFVLQTLGTSRVMANRKSEHVIVACAVYICLPCERLRLGLRCLIFRELLGSTANE